MPYTAEGYWVPNLAPRQFDVFNCYKRYVLVSGPRKSSKTIAVLHRLMRHAWEVPRARIAVIGKTAKNIKTGIWDVLYRTIAHEWAENMSGFKITKEVATDGVTKMPYFRVSNQWGGESEFQLHSLDNESEIETKMKSTEFTCIFVSELTNFRTDKVFNFTIPQLRGLGVKREDQMWIADTNPDEEDGDQFWAYNIWYEQRVQEDHPRPSFQDQLCLIEFAIKDNIFLTFEEVEELEGLYGRDPDLRKVYIEGKWIQVSKDSLFTGVFSPTRHVIGGDEELEPEEECTELVVGWDPGDTNHAVHILEKVDFADSDYPVWKALDELVVINANVSLEEFSLAVADMMDEWEERMGKQYRWRHWSDISAIERYRGAAGTWDQMVIYSATQGRIRVEGVPKFSGSVRLRVQIIKQLLQNDRLIISGNRCPALVNALRGGVKRGSDKTKYLKSNDHKHPFDSVSYPILAESSWDLVMGGAAPASLLQGVSVQL